MWASNFSLDGPGLASAQLADDMGVVMGTSHHEPCMRAGVEYGMMRGKDSPYGVNFSLAMKICFDFLRGVAPPNIESLISKYILPIRPDRNYARQHRVQKPASLSYRFV